MKPRNTLVTVVEVKDADRKTDSGLVLPSSTGREYKVCEVVAVGPGMITAAGELSPCRDLQSGQTVLVKLLQQRQISQDQAVLQPIGVGFTDDDGRALTLVEQSQIVAILDKKPAGLSLVGDTSASVKYGELPGDATYE